MKPLTEPSTAAPASGPVERSHREILTVLAGLMTAMFLAALDQTIVATALPTIVGELGGLSQLSWVATAYLMTSTVAVPLYGKISDLYGRKQLFQAAIVVFVLGSVTCGAAQSMGQLVGARALQGAGAGGLMALTQTIIGDIIPPRQRGRYMGYIGSVFGVASVVGPLLGGYFVDNLSWRWAFYVNVPLGIAALLVTQRNLRLPRVRQDRRIDYAGAALLTACIVTLLLVTVWGGSTYAWTSPVILGLAATSAVALATFVLVERRAAEPILPLELFREPVFAVSAGMLVLIGATMFGTIVYLPLFLQVVLGASATNSGLLMLPLMSGLLASVITSGRLITRWGRYRVFPIVGTALLSLGVGLLSTMDAGTSRALVSAYMVIVGVGLGLVMQVLVLVVQNAVPVRHLGAATSGAQFFRSIGGTVGIAVFGALLNARLAGSLTAADLQLPSGADAEALLSTPAAIGALPEALRAGLQTALADAVAWVFLLAVPVTLAAFALSWVLEERPLRGAAAPAHDAAAAL